uniref:Morc S5 domain-containing protein n=1 Tax=Lactuca sativa TaxID=4236 RepID=A0A9R1VL31_LACSA|nr:hypothetical protein LSAT_V11C500233350 [Lactuca sativa]
MDEIKVKQEFLEPLRNNNGDSTRGKNVSEIAVIDLDSSDDDSSTSGNGVSNGKRSRVSGNGGDDEGHGDKRKKSGQGVVLPAGFLDPLPPKDVASRVANGTGVAAQSCKQFWKAGDFEQSAGDNWETSSGGMDHVRVHPRFLHSNATSHKWVLGAFAELLDNSLDEINNGATYVNIDMLTNKKDGNRMLLIEDNGGGMDPDKMRQCMSLGYSLKSKVADAIGQYGNGFKTSTMRLGADVIVFSRCSPKDGTRPTQSIGLLSYTFLRCTGKEDIVVPMLDYEKGVREWKNIIRSSSGDWDKNMEAMVQWSPFSSETELLKQFDHMKDQGTRIIIYNLWEDDQGQLELDFETDKNDIQIRGVNRDEKNIQMANKFPNSKHFLTYRHSLRSYASILYLRIPPGFRMILRGKDVEHHNIVNDMMMITEVTYRPQPGADVVSKDTNIVAVVTMGFVKDAKSHIDVQGYNVYHKNRLIKPFWRLWNSTGSDGRGVIGVLEANFVEPAHDKQGFERTIVLSRLESRLLQMQKTYWRTHCHKIGYAPRISNSSLHDSETSPDYTPETSSRRKKASNKSASNKNQKIAGSSSGRPPMPAVNGLGGESTPLKTENIHEDDLQDPVNTSYTKSNPHYDYGNTMQIVTQSHSHPSNVTFFKKLLYTHLLFLPDNLCFKCNALFDLQLPIFGENGSVPINDTTLDLDQLEEENRQLKEKLKRKEDAILGDLLHELENERARCKALEAQLEEVKEKCEALNKEQESIIDVFAEERERRDKEEETLRKKLKETTTTIQDLVDRVKQLELEKMRNHNWNTA